MRSFPRPANHVNFLDGNPPKLPGWVPYQGLGTPSFRRPPSRNVNLIGHASGDRDRRAAEALRAEETFHLFRSPFLEGHGGVLAGRSGSGTNERPADRNGQQVCRVCSKQDTTQLVALI